MTVRFYGLFFSLFLFYLPLFAQIEPQVTPPKNRHLLVFPIVTKSIETGWSFGTIGAFVFRNSLKDTISRTSNLEAVGLYSTKKQLVTAINGSEYFNKERYILNEQVSYSSFPDKFWGLGNHTPDNAVEPYKFNQYYVYLHLLRKIAPHFFLGILYERQEVWKVSYIAGGLFDKENIVGRNGYSVAGVGGSLTFDSRNNAFSPDKGLYGQLYFNHFDKFWGSNYNYDNIVVDLRKYIPLMQKQVLALQLYSFNNTGNEVPLRSLASFGGANLMRGYYAGRYKDQQQMVFQAEYRFPVYKAISAVAFGGTGEVAGTFREYTLTDLKYSYGCGIRYALSKKEKLNLRIDYGIGQGNNNGFYIQLGEAF